LAWLALIGIHSIQGQVLDAILEPENHQVLYERCNPILLKVRMLVMLLDIKVHILVKVEVLLVAFVSEGLKLGKNGAP
jgi:hypothetical protein